MSSKKIIITVLIVIAAAAVIFFSFDKFADSADKNSREKIVNDLKIISKEAQSYYFKTDDMGFSERSFIGWNVPENYLKYDAGSISAFIKDQQVVINAYGKDVGKNEKSKVKVQAFVLPDSVNIKILN